MGVLQNEYVPNGSSFKNGIIIVHRQDGSKYGKSANDSRFWKLSSRMWKMQLKILNPYKLWGNIQYNNQQKLSDCMSILSKNHLRNGIVIWKDIEGLLSFVSVEEKY